MHYFLPGVVVVVGTLQLMSGLEVTYDFSKDCFNSIERYIEVIPIGDRIALEMEFE